MLGSGRPFVLEIQNPKKRGLNLRELEEIVNSQAGGKIVVSDLRFADLNDIEKIKKASFNKTYRAKIEFEGEVEEERLVNALRSISNTVIMQKTPERVKHRRADILRKRRTFDVRLLLCRNRIAVVEIDAESGLYIKELISGDNGRTSPSLSEVLNNYARVSKLDVIKVWDNI
jgi:tRNA pseudouridine synthase 10